MPRKRSQTFKEFHRDFFAQKRIDAGRAEHQKKMDAGIASYKKSLQDKADGEKMLSTFKTRGHMNTPFIRSRKSK